MGQENEHGAMSDEAMVKAFGTILRQADEIGKLQGRRDSWPLREVQFDAWLASTKMPNADDDPLTMPVERLSTVFAADLAARASGYVVMDATAQPYRVLWHGVVAIKGEWGPLAWEEVWRAWELILGGYPLGYFDCIAYEVPGWAGQSGDSGSGHGTSRRTRRMLDQAEALFGSIAVAFTRRMPMALDQAVVKMAITGQRSASKAAVSLALELRRQDGEWAPPEGEEATDWTDHERDALAIALTAVAKLRQEEMA